MRYGVIGNCQYSALVDTFGRVVWLCWPRFDSSFVFGSLLDEQRGGTFSLAPPDGSEGVQEYLTNTNVLRTEFSTPSGRFEVIDFAPRFYQFDRYYKPTMLMRIVRPVEGQPFVKARCVPTADYGKNQCDAHMGSNHLTFHGADQRIRLTTNASLNFVMEGRPFVVDKTYYFVLTYGPPFESELEHTCEQFLVNTIRYWRRWIKHCYIPSEFQKEVIRSALVLKLHQFEDTGAIIASATMSLPEADGSARNWDYRYCWLRDALFSLMALQRLTQFEEMESFVSYLRNVVQSNEETGGKLQPVYGISGERELTEHILGHLSGFRGNKPVRIGNQAFQHIQNDVYGEMILAIGPLFLDLRFASDLGVAPQRLLRSLLGNIEETMESHDAGLWEFRGIAQVHTFTVLMHWAGASMAVEICRKSGFQDLLAKAEILRDRASQIIDKKCWNKELGAFTQAIGEKHLDASLLMLINLGFLSPSDPRAKSHLRTIVRDLSTPGGFLHRYRRFDDFGATENAFTLCSFWLAEAYGKMGMRDEGVALFEKLLACGNHLGLYSEDIDPRSGELWGNFPQTYSHVGLINAAFTLATDLPACINFGASKAPSSVNS